MLKGTIVLGIYIMISLFSIHLVYNDNKRYDNNIKIGIDLKPKSKISVFTMVIISSLFTFFNFFSTNISSEYGSDRINYMYEFTGMRSTGSFALDYLFKIFRNLGGNIEIFFYFTTFVCVFLTLLAYRISKETNYKVFILMLTSGWIIFTLSALKQTYACAFACLFFVFLIEDRSKRGGIFSFILAIIASSFHITGLILFFIIILNKIENLIKKKIMIVILLIIIGIYNLELFGLPTQKIVEIFFPIYADKIKDYFAIVANGKRNWGSFIKYFSIYYVLILGIIKREKYLSKVKDYDQYLMITVIGIGLVMYTVKIYWFLRFCQLFYFPIFIFYNLLNNKVESKLEKNFNNIIVYGGGAMILAREIILIFINYGQF